MSPLLRTTVVSTSSLTLGCSGLTGEWRPASAGHLIYYVAPTFALLCSVLPRSHSVVRGLLYVDNRFFALMAEVLKYEGKRKGSMFLLLTQSTFSCTVSRQMINLSFIIL